MSVWPITTDLIESAMDRASIAIGFGTSSLAIARWCLHLAVAAGQLASGFATAGSRASVVAAATTVGAAGRLGC